MDKLTKKLDEEKLIASSMIEATETASIIYGIMLIIISMFLFTSPGSSYILATILLGVYLIVRGIIDFIAIFNKANKHRILTTVFSIINIITGFVVLSSIVFSTIVLMTLVVYIIGFNFIFMGIMDFKNSILMAIINIIIGVMMFFFTGGAALGFIWALAFFILLEGIFLIVFGAKLNNVSQKINSIDNSDKKTGENNKK